MNPYEPPQSEKKEKRVKASRWSNTLLSLLPWLLIFVILGLGIVWAIFEIRSSFKI